MRPGDDDHFVHLQARGQVLQQAGQAMLAQANVSQDLVTYLLKKYIS